LLPKKKLPLNYEVHAVNGLALVKNNMGLVMSSLKTRPVTLDVRPIGWKPKEKLLEIERKRALDDAEHQQRVALEEQRRDGVAQANAEIAEKEAAEKAERGRIAKAQKDEAIKRAREKMAVDKAAEQEFLKAIAVDPEPLRAAANALMEAPYGTSVTPEKIGRRGLPLRCMTRRKEVAWWWAGIAQELIGGGLPDAGSEWSN